MRKDRNTSISKAKSYEEIGDFWDKHSLANYWNKTKVVKFDVDIRSELSYYPLDNKLSKKMQVVSKRRGVPADTLLNLWVQEKLQEQGV